MFFQKKRKEESLRLNFPKESVKIWEEIENDSNGKNWLALKYENKDDLLISGHGEGGFGAAREVLREDEISFVIIKGCHVRNRDVIQIIVLVLWIPDSESLGEVEKAKAKLETVEVSKFFQLKNLHLIHASSESDLKNEKILKEIQGISRASGRFVIDGSSKTKYFKFAREKELKKNTTSEKKEQAKNNVFKEILSTENTYVEALKLFFSEFLDEMSKVAPSYEKKLRTSMRTIKEINVPFLNKLKEAYAITEVSKDSLEKMKLDPEKISKIVDVLVLQAPIFRLYVPYVNNYENSLQTYQNLRSKNSDFRSFIDEKQDSLNKRKERCSAFTGFLIMPIQRIPRYQLLFRDLLKQTSPGDPNFTKISEGAKKMVELATYMNSKKAEAEMSVKTIEISQKYKMQKQLMSHGRKMKKFGDCRVDEEVSQICVFNNLLLLCPNKKKTCTSISLEDEDIRVYKNPDEDENIFFLETGRKIITISMDKKDVVKDFIKLIQSILNENLKKGNIEGVLLELRQQFDYPIFSSFLVKEAVGMMASNRRRWHELTCDYKIKYYVEEKKNISIEKTKTMMKGSYSVFNATFGIGNPNHKNISMSDKQCYFYIKNKKRTYCLITEDVLLLYKWIEILGLMKCIREDVCKDNELKKYQRLREKELERIMQEKENSVLDITSRKDKEEESEGEEDKNDSEEERLLEIKRREKEEKDARKKKKEIDDLMKILDEKNKEFEEKRSNAIVEKEEKENIEFQDDEESDNDELLEDDEDDDDVSNSPTSSRIKKKKKKKRKKKKRRRPPSSTDTINMGKSSSPKIKKRRRPPKREKDGIMNNDDVVEEPQISGELARKKDEIEEREKQLNLLEEKNLPEDVLRELELKKKEEEEEQKKEEKRKKEQETRKQMEIGNDEEITGKLHETTKTIEEKEYAERMKEELEEQKIALKLQKEELENEMKYFRETKIREKMLMEEEHHKFLLKSEKIQKEKILENMKEKQELREKFQQLTEKKLEEIKTEKLEFENHKKKEILELENKKTEIKKEYQEKMVSVEAKKEEIVKEKEKLKEERKKIVMEMDQKNENDSKMMELYESKISGFEEKLIEKEKKIRILESKLEEEREKYDHKIEEKDSKIEDLRKVLEETETKLHEEEKKRIEEIEEIENEEKKKIMKFEENKNMELLALRSEIKQIRNQNIMMINEIKEQEKNKMNERVSEIEEVNNELEDKLRMNIIDSKILEKEILLKNEEIIKLKDEKESLEKSVDENLEIISRCRNALASYEKTGTVNGREVKDIAKEEKEEETSRNRNMRIMSERNDKGKNLGREVQLMKKEILEAEKDECCNIL